MLRKLIAVAAGAVLTLSLTTGPAEAEAVPVLWFAMGYEEEPLQYWILDDPSGPGVNFVEGHAPIFETGTGAPVAWHAAPHPVGGEAPFSVRLNPTAKRSGQYLRSATKPGLEGLVSGEPTHHGSIVIWFRIPKALPTYTQVLAVDNGAFSGTGGGLMIDTRGRLVSEDVSGFVDFRSKRQLNDNRWHCAIWTDTYHPAPDGAGSTLYLDGLQITDNLINLWVPRLGVNGSRLLLGDGGPHETQTIGRLKGNLSNVAIYDYILDIDDVDEIWTIGSTGSFGDA